MNNENPDSTDAELPQAEVRASGRRRISTVWIIPIIAAILAGGLAWRTLSERGPTITLSFDNADGLEAGKTIVSHRSVPIGTVQDIALADDIQSVLVTVQMRASSRKRLNKDAKFWVVRPRLGVAGVSGLSTLVSGNYIGADLGSEGGVFQNHFIGLEDPPLENSGGLGLAIELVAEKLGGLSKDAPIYHREVVVGTIQGYVLSEDGRSVVIHAIIESETRLRKQQVLERQWARCHREPRKGRRHQRGIPPVDDRRRRSIRDERETGEASPTRGPVHVEPARGQF